MTNQLTQPTQAQLLYDQMQKHGITLDDLATRLEPKFTQPARLIKDIIAGHTEITWILAIELGEIFGTTPDWWLENATPPRAPRHPRRKRPRADVIATATRKRGTRKPTIEQLTTLRDRAVEQLLDASRERDILRGAIGRIQRVLSSDAYTESDKLVVIKMLVDREAEAIIEADDTNLHIGAF